MWDDQPFKCRTPAYALPNSHACANTTPNP